MQRFFSTTRTFNGVQLENVDFPPERGVTAQKSNLLAAATQLDGARSRFTGDASIEILNTAPAKSGVKVNVNVLWNSPILFRLAFVVWP